MSRKRDPELPASNAAFLQYTIKSFFPFKKNFKAKPDGFIYLLTPWLKDNICFSFTVSIKKSKKL
jgi:hypothetical protein